MEAADRATGNRDEQEGNQHRRAGLVSVVADRRGHKFQRGTRGTLFWGSTAQEGGGAKPQDQQPQRGQQLESVDVVAGLQQGPHRQHRGHVRVKQ